MPAMPFLAGMRVAATSGVEFLRPMLLFSDSFFFYDCGGSYCAAPIRLLFEGLSDSVAAASLLSFLLRLAGGLPKI